MMTREMMMDTLEALGEDVSVYVDREGTICVTLEDFEGFDDDWSEVDREYTDPEAVEDFEEMLEAECTSREGDYYVVFHFEGFDLQLGYASFDI